MFRSKHVGVPEVLPRLLEQEPAEPSNPREIDRRAVENILCPSRNWCISLNDLPGLSESCLPLPVDYVDFALFRIELMRNVDTLLKCDTWRIEKSDVSGVSSVEIRALLGSHQAAGREWVALLRPIDSAGLSVRYQDFVCHYDQFWWPWGDDLLVVGLDFTWLLEMDHEEVVTFMEVKGR